jgi:hypothetical protein
VEDRILGLKDKIGIKGKTEELLIKQFKSYERNILQISHTIKRTNLRIIGIKEREEEQATRICNIFNKIIAENFPSLKKELPIQIQEATRTPNRLDQKKNLSMAYYH